MSVERDLYNILLEKFRDPHIRGRIRRALDVDLVLDTWLNGEHEESFTAEAEGIISRAAEEFTRQAMESGAVFPGYPMPEGYIRSVFQELLSSTALFQAQKYTGVRDVEEGDARNAEAILSRFILGEPDGLSAAAGVYFVISAHEDLNAIHYYRRMRREDFLLGTLHRPWSNMMLTNQLNIYQGVGLLTAIFTGEGEMLELTPKGEELLGVLREILEEAGEFEWRSSAQRWVIFGETDYDQVFRTVFPDTDGLTEEYIRGLEIPRGARVLEIGAGTGRATCDLGLARRVAEAGGTLVALEPSAALINVLHKKCQEQEMNHIQIVQGVVESLPFPDNIFDLVVSVAVLHFTDLEKASMEMMRVTKPGGVVSAGVPLSFSALDIPMATLWFRPLQALADRMGVPFGERQGLPKGATESAFRAAGLERVRTTMVAGRAVASDPNKFLQFMLKGAAFYQNILSRLPFKERWEIIHLLEGHGHRLVASTTSDEQVHLIPGEIVEGGKPATDKGLALSSGPMDQSAAAP